MDPMIVLGLCIFAVMTVELDSIRRACWLAARQVEAIHGLALMDRDR